MSATSSRSAGSTPHRHRPLRRRRRRSRRPCSSTAARPPATLTRPSAVNGTAGAGSNCDRSGPRPVIRPPKVPSPWICPVSMAPMPCTGPVPVQRHVEPGRAVAAGARQPGGEMPGPAGEPQRAGGGVAAGPGIGGQRRLDVGEGEIADAEPAVLDPHRGGGEPGGRVGGDPDRPERPGHVHIRAAQHQFLGVDPPARQRPAAPPAAAVASARMAMPSPASARMTPAAVSTGCGQQGQRDRPGDAAPRAPAARTPAWRSNRGSGPSPAAAAQPAPPPAPAPAAAEPPAGIAHDPHSGVSRPLGGGP